MQDSEARRVPRRGIFHARELHEPPELINVDKQCVIRFPPPVATELRKRLETPPGKLGLVISPTEREDFRIFNVDYEKVLGQPGSTIRMTGVLVELPTICESYKSVDGDFFFKSGDVSQMIVVTGYDKREVVDLGKLRDEKNWERVSGITPPTHRILTRKFRNHSVLERADVQSGEFELMKETRGKTQDRAEFEASTKHALNAQLEQLKQGGLDKVTSIVAVDQCPFGDADIRSDLSDELFQENQAHEAEGVDWDQIGMEERAIMRKRNSDDSSGDEAELLGISRHLPKKKIRGTRGRPPGAKRQPHLH